MGENSTCPSIQFPISLVVGVRPTMHVVCLAVRRSTTHGGNDGLFMSIETISAESVFWLGKMSSPAGEILVHNTSMHKNKPLPLSICLDYSSKQLDYIRFCF